MAINYIFDTENEELVKKLKPALSKFARGENITIYITDDVEKLIKKQENNTKNIVVTCNCSKEFITNALKITDYIVYKFDIDVLITKLKMLIGKVEK